MNTKCPRCEGKKTYRKEVCVKCNGKGYLTADDNKLVKQLKSINKKYFK